MAGKPGTHKGSMNFPFRIKIKLLHVFKGGTSTTGLRSMREPKKERASQRFYVFINRMIAWDFSELKVQRREKEEA